MNESEDKRAYTEEEKRERAEGRTRGFLRRWGFYAAVALAVAAAGFLSYTAVNGMLEATAPKSGVEQKEQERQEEGALIRQQNEEPVPEQDIAEASQPEAQEQQPDDAPPKEPKPPAQETLSDAPLISRYIPPVAGEKTVAFSGDRLVYNTTMKDWRTHNGVDFVADAGSEVVAIASGRVVSVEEDALWGNTITVKLDSGYTAIYSNLETVSGLDPGELVSQGDVLGAVGSSSVIEKAEPPHLHFELKQGDSYVDPMTLIA